MEKKRTVCNFTAYEMDCYIYLTLCSLCSWCPIISSWSWRSRRSCGTATGWSLYSIGLWRPLYRCWQLGIRCGRSRIRSFRGGRSTGPSCRCWGYISRSCRRSISLQQTVPNYIPISNSHHTKLTTSSQVTQLYKTQW